MSNQIQELIQSVITEGVMDHETTQISRQVVELVKTYLGVKRPKSKTTKFTSDDLQIKAVMTVDEKFQKIVMLHGEYQANRYKPGIDTSKLPPLPPDQIELNIGIPKDSTKIQSADLEPFVLALKGVLRHELEHAQQRKRGLQTTTGSAVDPWSSPDTSKVFLDPSATIAYYTSPDEVEAYVMQIYRMAKMKKITFAESLKQYIAGFIGPKVLKNMPVAQGIRVLNVIKKSWVEYAKKRLPALFTEH